MGVKCKDKYKYINELIKCIKYKTYSLGTVCSSRCTVMASLHYSLATLPLAFLAARVPHHLTGWPVYLLSSSFLPWRKDGACMLWLQGQHGPLSLPRGSPSTHPIVLPGRCLPVTPTGWKGQKSPPWTVASCGCHCSSSCLWWISRVAGHYQLLLPCLIHLSTWLSSLPSLPIPLWNIH